MKNFDAKKLLVFLLIIAVVALIGFGLFKLIQGASKPSEKEQSASETLAVKYYLNLTNGYNDVFDGIDILFSKDKYSVEDIPLEAKYNICIKYAMNNELDLFPDDYVISSITNGQSDGIAAYKIEAINEAAKKLFGEELKFENATNEDFIYNYYYNDDYKVLLAKLNDRDDNGKTQNGIDYKIISTKKDGNNIVVEVAIAYVAIREDGTYTYSATSDYSKTIANGISEYKLPEDKVNEFPHYKITMAKANDSYVFKSIEKTDK